MSPLTQQMRRVDYPGRPSCTWYLFEVKPDGERRCILTVVPLSHDDNEIKRNARAVGGRIVAFYRRKLSEPPDYD